MEFCFNPLINQTQSKVYHTINGVANLVEDFSDIEVVAKAVLGALAVFELPYMQEMPASLQIINKDLKSLLEVAGSVKILTRIRDFASFDAVGRAYWKTHSWIEISCLSLSAGYGLLGTAKYGCKIFEITFPSYLSMTKTVLMLGACSLRVWKDIESIQKNNKQIQRLEEKKDNSIKKISSKDWNELKYRYSKKITETKIEIISRELTLNQMVKDLNIKDVSKKRNIAFQLLDDLEHKKAKIHRWNLYLDLENLEDYKALKTKKWESRITQCQNEVSNKKYNFLFDISLASSLGLSLVATAFSCEQVALLTLLSGMGVFVPSVGLAGMINRIPKTENALG